jgi:hypothetical protein
VKHLVKNLAVVATLGATALLLIADSVEKCPHPEQRITFAVSGNCGPAGTLRFSIPEDRCDFEAEGADAVDLPPIGRFRSDGSNKPSYDLLQSGWSLSGDRIFTVTPDGGTPGSDAGSGEQHGSRSCEAVREGNLLKLSCVDSIYPPGQSEPTVISRCEAVLTPQ